MVYVKVENGVVTHKRPTPAQGFVSAPAHVVPGFLHDGEAFSQPVITPTEAELLAHVETLREEKLAAGFDYDFGDGRGVHTFGTTPADRRGWAEVEAIATAANQAGQATLQIDIRTDTGDVTIEAQEWPAIRLAATQTFQPVWQASWTVKDAVKTGSVTTFAEVEGHAAWPF